MATTRIFSGYFGNKHRLNTFKTFLQKTLLSGIVCSFLLLHPGIFQYNVSQPEAFAQAIFFTGMEKVVQPEFLDKFNQGVEKVRIIVLLKGYKAFKGLSIAEDAISMKAVQSTIHNRQEHVLNALEQKQFQLKHRFENILGFSGEATLQAIDGLAKMDGVELIEEDKKAYKNTSEGIPLIGGDGLHSMGYYGSGISIAICDTGVDYSHPELGGGGFPNSKVIGGYDLGDSDSDPMDCEGHGTAAAGIAAGDSGGGYGGGVAPSAKIYALKIISGCGGSAYFSDIAAAWDWCVTHKNDDPNNPIMIISTSFGGDYFTTPCDATYPTMAASAANAIANGITVFVSSGNDGLCDGMGAPACLTDAISVGAVYDANIGQYPPSGYVGCISNGSCVGYTSGCPCDEKCYVDGATAMDQVTTYSNSASFLDILAASNCATTTDIVGSGGYDSGNYDSCFGGTSAACPYAAGAGAILQNYAKSQTGVFITPAQLKSALVTYGDSVTDYKNGLSHPRINVLASTAAIGGPVTTTIGSSTTTTIPVTTTTTISPEDMPNLVPCAPYRWSSPIVPSSQQGTNTHNPGIDVLYPTPRKTYIDFAFCNENNSDVTESFSVALYIDEVEAFTVEVEDVIAGKSYKSWTDEQFGLAEGQHMIKIVVDVYDDVIEANEDDNTLEMSFTWKAALWPGLYREMFGNDYTEEIHLLRDFRDKRLISSKKGKTYVDMLYRNSFEIASLLLKDEGLRVHTASVIEQLLPELALLLNGEKVEMSSQMIFAIEDLLNEFGAKASPSVKRAVKRVRKEIKEGEVFDQLGIEIE